MASEAGCLHLYKALPCFGDDESLVMRVLPVSMRLLLQSVSSLSCLTPFVSLMALTHEKERHCTDVIHVCVSFGE